MTYEIKVATEADRKWSIEVAGKQMMCSEMKRPDLYNKQQLHLVYNLIIKDETGLICWKDGERVGCVAGIKTKHFLNPNIDFIFEVVWYVDRNVRNTRVPYLLMKHYTEMVKEKADEGVFTILGHTPIKDESLAKFGWKLQERHYGIRG